MKTTLFLTLALFLGIVDRSRADVVVEPPGAVVAGKTIGEWSAAWWQWAVALAPPGNPFSDGTGEFADVNQSGPVFFLAGSLGGSNSRHFEVPAGTYTLVPLPVGEYSQLELGFGQTAAQVRQAAQQQADNIDSLHATLDGTALSPTVLFTHRETSPDFAFVAVAGNLVNVPAGASGIAVADGYFLMLGPLTPGTHVLNYGGGATAYGISVDETDTITVGPHFVDAHSPNPIPPYTNWATAAATIQDAVNAASYGGEILVTNGIYATGSRSGNRVQVDKRLSLRSVNGPLRTVIDGGASVRCVELANRAFLAGFTLTNGFVAYDPFTNMPTAPSGGGVAFDGYPSSAVVSNCVIVGNSAGSGGGAASALVTGGLMPMGGTLIHCVLSNNSATAFQPGNGTLGIGGAADNCTLDDCILAGNFAAYGGGGASASRLLNCTVTGNSANAEGGAARWSTLFNCLVTSNSAGAGATFSSTLINCTVAGNPAGGAYSGFLTNCIVYDNGGGGNQIGATLNYCCTTPLPQNGIGNITNAPSFVDQVNGNLRLQSNSPCVNAGDNTTVVGSTDLDGRPRFQGGTIDIGAYEYQPGVSGAFLGWLQQFGLPTDGSADYADSDSDLLNNWQEWIAGTIPTDAASALRLLKPTKAVSGVTVSWQSVSHRTYFLERATNLGAAPPFFLLTSNLVGQAGTTSYTDTNATGPSPFFYRVGVQ